MMSEAGPVMESHGFAIAKKYLKTRDKNSLWTPPPMPESPTQGSASEQKIADNNTVNYSRGKV